MEHEIIFSESRTLKVRTDLSLLLDEDSKPVKVEGKTIDITSIKSSQKELERLSLIASKTSNAVVILDAACRVDWINTGFTIMTGYRMDEIKNTPVEEYLISGKSEISDPKYLSIKLSEHHSINEELRLKTKRKNELWVLVDISPILDYELNPISYIMIMSDITQQRLVAEELRQTEKMAALGKLSAGLAHELNNPASASVRAADQLIKVMAEMQKVTLDLAKGGMERKYWDTISFWLKKLLNNNEKLMKWLDNNRL